MAIYKEQAQATGKPDNILEKIATGKLDKYLRAGLPAGAAVRQG